MKAISFSPKLIFVTSVILITAVSRLIPHWYNFTPVAAIALFGGVHLSSKRLAFVVPLLAMIVSDVLVNIILYHQTNISSYFFSLVTFSIYASFMLTVLVGIWFKNRVNLKSIVSASVVSSLLFFFITNFAVWCGSTFYTQSLSGLLTCYVAAIPFLANGFLGDLFYTGVLFGVFRLAQVKFPALLKT